MPLRDKASNMHVAIMRKAADITPVFMPVFSAGWLGPAKWEYLSAVMAGLYKSRVIAVFSPPLIKLKGRNAGSSSSITASLEQPI